jgi:hypothetical protein
MFQRKTLILLLTTVLTAMLAVPASAAVEEGSNSFEIYAGVYFPDGSTFDEAATYGLRFGRAFTSRWGGEISAGYYEDDAVTGAGTVASPTLDNDLDIINIDLDVVFFANPDSSAVFTVYGGIGWANTDWKQTDVVAKTSTSADSDSFTVNAGIGGRFYLGAEERVFLRIDGRARYFEDRDDDEIDFEATFGVGWVWGN